MQIRDLTNFEELTVPEAANVTGGKMKTQWYFYGPLPAHALPDLPPPPPPPPAPPAPPLPLGLKLKM